MYSVITLVGLVKIPGLYSKTNEASEKFYSVNWIFVLKIWLT